MSAPVDILDRMLLQVEELTRFEVDATVEIELVGRHDHVYLYRVVFRFREFYVETFRGPGQTSLGPPHFAFRDVPDGEEIDLEATVEETGLPLVRHCAFVLGEIRRLLDEALAPALHQAVARHLERTGLQSSFIEPPGDTEEEEPTSEFCHEMVSVSRSLTSALDAQNRVTRRKFDQLVDVLERIWLTFSRFDEQTDWSGSEAVNTLADRLQEVREELQTPLPAVPTTLGDILELAGSADEEDEVETTSSAAASFEMRIAGSLAASHANAVSVQQRIDETCLRLSHALVLEFERALAWKVSQMVARRIVTEDP